MSQPPLDTVLSLTERLTAQIRRETALLQGGEPRDIAKLHDDKMRLTELYTHEMALLRRNPGVVKAAAPADIDRLKKLTAGFRAALSEHGSLIGALRSVTEGMVKAVAGEVARHNNPVRSYGGDAIMRDQMGASPTSIALNQVI